ncbi:hypothetical protein P167DRAFT_603690 [Morchella conica CCBAS932]|uniref:Uncharacterized protein n=1 Tax=Morchella conica CCBAS932 TaxID=1392247 RepID=A0A3N4KWX1_9PEZI|nr:hypothetical protein P167DRAFT_603690 [Morchella conica CCBAS932]
MRTHELGMFRLQCSRQHFWKPCGIPSREIKKIKIKIKNKKKQHRNHMYIIWLAIGCIPPVHVSTYVIVPHHHHVLHRHLITPFQKRG